MRRLFLAAVALVATFAAACGGSGGNSTVPPPSGGFTKASLKGQYTFSMSGLDLTGFSLSRIGSFIADGNGGITGALEDVLDEGAAVQTVSFTGASNYTMDASGHGTIQLFQTQGSNVGIQLNFVLSSTAGGNLIQTDANASTAGTFSQASATTPATFSQAQISGNYVFDVAGVAATSGGDVALSLLGQIKTNGTSISGGVVDENDGANGPSGAQQINANVGSIVLDSNSNGTSFGRGTLSIPTTNLGTFHFIFYIVDATHLKFLSTDAGIVTSGDAFQQSAGVPTTSPAFNSSFAMLLGGVDTGGPLAEVARFTADGSQNLNNVFLDFNDGGGTGTVSNPTARSYSIDGNNPGSGRGTLAFTDSSNFQFQFVFYLYSGSQGFIQDTSQSTIADGPLELESPGPFTAASTATNFAVQWSGFNLKTGFELDALGQYVLPLPAGQANNGAVDIVSLGSTGTPVIPNDPIMVNITINGDGTLGGNQYSLQTGKSPTSNLKFVAYNVNQQKVFMIGILPSEVDAGSVVQQH